MALDGWATWRPVGRPLGLVALGYSFYNNKSACSGRVFCLFVYVFISHALKGEAHMILKNKKSRQRYRKSGEVWLVSRYSPFRMLDGQVKQADLRSRWEHSRAGDWRRADHSKKCSDLGESLGNGLREEMWTVDTALFRALTSTVAYTMGSQRRERLELCFGI